MGRQRLAGRLRGRCPGAGGQWRGLQRRPGPGPARPDEHGVLPRSQHSCWASNGFYSSSASVRPSVMSAVVTEDSNGLPIGYAAMGYSEGLLVVIDGKVGPARIQGHLHERWPQWHGWPDSRCVHRGEKRACGYRERDQGNLAGPKWPRPGHPAAGRDQRGQRGPFLGPQPHLA